MRQKRAGALAKRLRREMTDAEVILWPRLRKRVQPGALFRRQHPIGPYIADFACVAAWLVIELDGATHSADGEIAHDARRDAYMAREGWRVMRFPNDDVYRHLGSVLDAVAAAVAERSA